MKLFEMPAIEVVKFSVQDVITTSDELDEEIAILDAEQFCF